MKKDTRIVICPKCSKPFSTDEIIKHVDSHSGQIEAPKSSSA